jgi:predicted nucleotidyltransferase
MESAKPTAKSREQVLEAAEACKRLLRERFGARRVILFGSLAGQAPWHAQSDVDLAVKGLAPTAWPQHGSQDVRRWLMNRCVLA